MKSKRKIFNEVMTIFKELGDDCLRVFLEKGNREKVKKFCKSLLRKKFVVKVDYKKTVEEKVVEIGYGEVNPYVNSEFFPINERKGVVEIEIEAFYLENEMTPSEAEESLKKHGLHPAEFEPFLSFEERNPEIRKQCSVACLGSHINYGRMCNMWYSYPYSFTTKEGKSVLTFTFKDHVFEKGTCIPAVR